MFKVYFLTQGQFGCKQDANNYFAFLTFHMGEDIT